MNRQQFDLIPDRFLKREGDGCRRLIDWLHERGWQMTLLELEDERRRRGMKAGR
jgi:hypothetical protein